MSMTNEQTNLKEKKLHTHTHTKSVRKKFKKIQLLEYFYLITNIKKKIEKK